MQIFVTSPCPVESARYLDDKRVIKMILESAQLLSTAVRELGIDEGYRPTHKNHPCGVWTRKSRQNFEWLVRHGLALANEYNLRYGKHHKSVDVILKLRKYTNKFPDTGLTKFANCAANRSLKIDYTHENNTFLAYQHYLNDRWDNETPTYYGRRLT